MCYVGVRDCTVENAEVELGGRVSGRKGMLMEGVIGQFEIDSKVVCGRKLRESD